VRQRPFIPRSEARRRPRLLIEDPSPALQLAECRLFEEAGLDVAVCSGPGDGDPCPLTGGGTCRLAEEADLVLMGPGMAGSRTEVAAALHRRRPDLPVLVQVPRSDPGRCPPGCIPDYYPASVDGQIRSVWRALDRRPATRPPAAPGPSCDAPPVSTAPSSTVTRLVDLLGW